MEFTLEKFNPTIAELTNLSEQYKGLKIQSIEDVEGYELVKKAQLDLRDKRVFISKTLKDYRQKAIDFQKSVIDQEKTLISIIEGTEKELKEERDRIDYEKELEKRRKIMPDRIKELENNNIEYIYDEILNMSSDGFNEFVMRKREEKILEAQRKIEEENKKIEEEKNRIEREKEIERIKKETEEKTKIETEQRMIKQQEEKEIREKLEKDNKEKEEKLKQEEINRNIEYNNWLIKNGYNENEYLITTNGNTKTMRKIHDTFILNLK